MKSHWTLSVWVLKLCQRSLYNAVMLIDMSSSLDMLVFFVFTLMDVIFIYAISMFLGLRLTRLHLNLGLAASLTQGSKRRLRSLGNRGNLFNPNKKKNNREGIRGFCQKYWKKKKKKKKRERKRCFQWLFGIVLLFLVRKRDRKKNKDQCDDKIFHYQIYYY